MGRAKVGAAAPDFELDGTDGPFKLSAHRGRRVVLLFYPGDNTPVCTRQFCSYRDDAAEMAALGAVVVGISSQSLESHQEFSAGNNLTVPLLADHGGKVAKAYGAHRGPLGTRRAMVIVDEEGRVAYRHDHTLGLDFQSAEQIREALESLASRV